MLATVLGYVRHGESKFWYLLMKLLYLLTELKDIILKRCGRTCKLHRI